VKISHIIGMICVAFMSILLIQGQETTPDATATLEINAANTDFVDAFLLVDNDSPFIGEPFTITIIVEVPNNVEIVDWPQFPEDNILEIINAQDIEIIENSNSTTFRQNLQAILWETGDYLTPELRVIYRINGSTRSADLVRSAFISVPSLFDSAADATLRPSVQPVDLPFIPRWLLVAGLALMSVITLTLARIIQSGRQHISRTLSGTPTQIAIAHLEDLKQQNLAAATLYPLVADHLRQYLQQHFAINAIELTTTELINTLNQNNLLAREQRQALRQLLEQADLVKFARFQPDNNATERLVNFAIKWLRDVGRDEEVAQ